MGQLLEQVLNECTAISKAVCSIEAPDGAKTIFSINLIQEGVTKRPSAQLLATDLVVVQLPGTLLSLTNRFVTDVVRLDVSTLTTLAYVSGTGVIALPDFVDTSSIIAGDLFIDVLFRTFSIISASNTPGSKNITLAAGLSPAPLFSVLIAVDPALNLKGNIIVPNNALDLTVNYPLAELGITLDGPLSQEVSSGDITIYIFDDGEQYPKIKEVLLAAITKS